MTRLLRLLATGTLLCLLATFPAFSATPGSGTTGILVVTPDRGFLGNSEIRDAFDAFAHGRNAEIVYITDQRSRKILNGAVRTLVQRGAKRLAVLPLVVSAADARWRVARDWLQADRPAGVQLAVAPVYGASSLAVADLSARLRTIQTHKHRLVLVGYGAGSAAAARAMADDMTRIAGYASTVGRDSIRAVVYPSNEADHARALRKQARKTLQDAHGALVIPLAFAPRADSMMSFPNWYTDTLPKDAQAAAAPIATADALAQWMARASAQASLQLQPATAKQVGVIVLAHGASWFWNQDIRQSLAPVAAQHKVAWAFAMADPVVVERAVRKLEQTDVRAIVLVRAYGMASSFRHAVRRMLGADVEGSASASPLTGHDMHMAHAEHTGMTTFAAAPRIRTRLPIVSVGGVEDDPLYAMALLQHARKLSKDPARETVILVAHGTGDDARNEHWLDVLHSLAEQMRANGADDFRAIEVATWREDWPEKRKAAVAKVRDMVKAANTNGGRTLVIPARINDQGRAGHYLSGLDFAWGTGFAQTPFFAEWVEKQIDRGVHKLATQAEAR